MEYNKDTEYPTIFDGLAGYFREREQDVIHEPVGGLPF
jgi:hypothetical protein